MREKKRKKKEEAARDNLENYEMLTSQLKLSVHCLPSLKHCQLSRCLTRRSWSTSLTTRHAMLDTTGIYFDTLHHIRLPWFHHPVIYPNIPSIRITLIALHRLFNYDSIVWITRNILDVQPFAPNNQRNCRDYLIYFCEIIKISKKFK